MITPKRPRTYRDQSEDKYDALARRIFEKKTVKKFYEVFMYDIFGDDWEDVGTSYYVPLSADQVCLLRNLQEEYEDELWELEEDIPFYEKLTGDDFPISHAPKSVDLDHPVHLYSFLAVEMETKDSKPGKRPFRVVLSDEEYLFLLKWRLQNRGLSFNSLVGSAPQLFCKLNLKATHILGCPDLGIEAPSPFLVFMEEIDKDVMDEVGEPDFNDQVYEGVSGGRRGHTVLDIKEKRLCFFLEDQDENAMVTDVWKELDEVDAIAVQSAMGASSYSDLYEKVKECFGKDLSGFDLFKKFLDDHSIAYKCSERIG